MIEVLSIGTEIIIDGDIPARIASICIENAEGSISYKCSWWDERKRNVEWLPSSEVTAKGAARKIQISLK